CWTNHQKGRIAIALHLIGRDKYDINSCLRVAQMTIDSGQKAPVVELPPLDDQEIEVAVRSHFPSRRRAEQDDLVRLGRFDNTPDDVCQHFSLDPAVLGANVVAAALHPSPPGRNTPPSPWGRPDGEQRVADSS